MWLTVWNVCHRSDNASSARWETLLKACEVSFWDYKYESLCCLVNRVAGYRSRGPGFGSRCYQNFWEVVGLERVPLSLVSTTEELLGRNSSGFGLENREYGRGDPLRWPRDTLHPQKLALTSPTSGGSSVGIILLRAKSTEFVAVTYIFFCTSPLLNFQIIDGWSSFILDNSMLYLWHPYVGYASYSAYSASNFRGLLPTEVFVVLFISCGDMRDTLGRRKLRSNNFAEKCIKWRIY
jgi:hypothetical protein